MRLESGWRVGERGSLTGSDETYLSGATCNLTATIVRNLAFITARVFGPYFPLIHLAATWQRASDRRSAPDARADAPNAGSQRASRQE